ncbi:hypothetical protein V3C99_013922 [Haemonchus contortus]
MSGGLDPFLLPLTFVFFFASTIGIVGNTIMIIVTFKAKRTKSPCHIMIALTCLADLTHEVGQYPFVYHFYRNATMIHSNCFWLQLIPMVGASIGSPLLLCLGLDRLIAVRFPSRYRFLQMVPYRYVLCSVSVPLVYSLYLITLAFLTKDQSLVQCAVPQSFGVVSFEKLNQIGVGVNVGIIVVYGLTFYLLKRSSASSKMKTVFKSIGVTVIIVICGWLLTFMANTFASVFTKDPYTTMVINMYAGVSVNLGLASNVFVYYAINAEYRDVMKQMFGCIGGSTAKKVPEVSTMHGLASRSTKSTGIVSVHA